MATQRFPFGPRGAVLFWAALFFSGCGAVFLHVASTGGQMRLFPTTILVRGAPVYGFAVLSFGFVGLAVAAYVSNRRHGARELVIEPDAFEIPKSVSSASIRRIERAHVQRFAAQNQMGTKVVSVITTSGPVHVSNRTVGEDGYQALRAWLERAG